ncbi:MAG TPA: hypothetical protein VJ826_06120 [Candidatus Polarisedimenticolaceae bacterium]|nr:hypothetical protein [Candidatus Polarisedimenticolaceae bacterium]
MKGWILAIALTVWATEALAEPAFAVRTGYRCSQCHVNRTGGGMRTSFGSIYTQTTLPMRLLRVEDRGWLLPADPDARFAVGADARFQALALNPQASPDTFSFEIPEANLYGEARLVPGRFSVYLDETVGPGGASTREAFGLVSFKRWDAYVKAGKFMPVYGWRLPDDAAFIRQFTGFTYSAPDIGIEVGAEPGRWSLQLSAVNGTAGGAEDNRAKQVSLLAVRRFETSRVGASGAHDKASGGAETTTAGLLGGVNIGRLGLLGEADWRKVEVDGDATDEALAFVEADFLVVRGVSFKYTHDYIDPDRDVSTDARTRDTFAIEWIPVPFVQLRLAAERRRGPPQVTGSRDRAAFLEAHFFF